MKAVVSECDFDDMILKQLSVDVDSDDWRDAYIAFLKHDHELSGYDMALDKGEIECIKSMPVSLADANKEMQGYGMSVQVTLIGENK